MSRFGIQRSSNPCSITINKQFRESPRFFRASAFAFLFTALIHTASLIAGPFTVRELIFVGINLLFAVLCIFRPRVFLPLLILLTVQQMTTHGRDLCDRWTMLHEIDWNSFVVLAFLITLVVITCFPKKLR